MNPPQMKQATAPLPGALPTQRHPLPRTGPRHLRRAPPVRRPRTARPSVWQELPQAQSRAQGLEGPFNFGTSMEFTDCLKEMKAGSRSPGLDHLSPSTLGTGRLHRDLPTAENTFMHGVYDLFSNLLTDLNEREAMKEVNAAYVVLGDAGRLPHQPFRFPFFTLLLRPTEMNRRVISPPPSCSMRSSAACSVGASSLICGIGSPFSRPKALRSVAVIRRRSNSCPNRSITAE